MQLTNAFAALASVLAVSAMPSQRATCPEASRSGSLSVGKITPGQLTSITMDYTCPIQIRGVPKTADYYLISTTESNDGNQLNAYLGRSLSDFVSASSPVDAFDIPIPAAIPTGTYNLRVQFTYNNGEYDQVLINQIPVTI